MTFALNVLLLLLCVGLVGVIRSLAWRLCFGVAAGGFTVAILASLIIWGFRP